MSRAMDFTAIDFETASHRRDSACQLAAVVVRGGKIERTAKWLIRPRPLYFSQSNIRVHGITPEAVQSEPEFGALWPEMRDLFAADCLVAHNASFDLGVLLACLRAHRRTVPEFQFTCTRAISRRTWPGRRSYGLKPLSDWLGVRFRHHDALEDAVACAKLLLAAGAAKAAATIDELEAMLQLERGLAGDWGVRGARCNRAGKSSTSGRRRRSPPTGRGGFVSNPQADSGPLDQDLADAMAPSVDLQRLMVRAEFIRPLSGKQVVFTGQFRCFSRDVAETLAAKLGATCQSSVTRRTNLVVVGQRDRRTVASGRTMSVKEERAERLREEGRLIDVVDEEAFLNLILAESPSRETVDTRELEMAGSAEMAGETNEATAAARHAR